MMDVLVISWLFIYLRNFLCTKFSLESLLIKFYACTDYFCLALWVTSAIQHKLYFTLKCEILELAIFA